MNPSNGEALQCWADVLRALVALDMERINLLTAYEVARFTVQQEESELALEEERE